MSKVLEEKKLSRRKFLKIGFISVVPAFLLSFILPESVETIVRKTPRGHSTLTPTLTRVKTSTAIRTKTSTATRTKTSTSTRTKTPTTASTYTPRASTATPTMVLSGVFSLDSLILDYTENIL
jgi:hypothetical protein